MSDMGIHKSQTVEMVLRKLMNFYSDNKNTTALKEILILKAV